MLNCNGLVTKIVFIILIYNTLFIRRSGVVCYG